MFYFDESIIQCFPDFLYIVQISSFEFLFLGWLFASQKSGFSGFRRQSASIPSLRFGTDLSQPFQSLPRVKRGTDLVSYFHNRIIDIRLVLSQQIYKIHFPASLNPLYHVPYIFSSFPKRSYSPIEFLLHLI